MKECLKDFIVRVTAIEIKNFKNVGHGSIELNNAKNVDKASILGLYGQNGSGKTSLIDSLEILKNMLMGNSLQNEWTNWINVNSNRASLAYSFIIKNENIECEYKVKYSFDIIRDNSVDRGITVENEVISCSYKGRDGEHILTQIIDTRNKDVQTFTPNAKYQILLGETDEIDVIVQRKMAYEKSTSFIFSKKFLNEFVYTRCTDEKYTNLFKVLHNYSIEGLFIVNTKDSGIISLDLLPLNIYYKDDNAKALGVIPIMLKGSSMIPKEQFMYIQTTLNNMNNVLKEIIPGLTIELEDLGTQLMPDMSEAVLVQLISNKIKDNDENELIKMPFQYESEGIKKIVSILSLLIFVYNNPSVLVAIDELDSGIFEYLFGELVSILERRGVGQLIFTSHNLRPLETLKKESVAFTTTDANNRYIKLKNIQHNHNLRNSYFRCIVVGGQERSIYNPTNNERIAFAFMQSGGVN